jgi:NAD(P)-dependent dehydrogenase (short-subunit alcohol dehydrogenase family)
MTPRSADDPNAPAAAPLDAPRSDSAVAPGPEPELAPERGSDEPYTEVRRARQTLDPAEVARTIELLERAVADRALLGTLSEAQRRALLEAAGRLSRPMRDEQRQLNRALRRGDRARDRAHDAQLLARTGMRQGKAHSWYVLPPRTEAPSTQTRTLREPRDCYVCKASYTELHHFYDALCPPCATLNWDKRHQRVALDGKVALVTGARIKIGYQATLILLRAGATVLATTRFPRDAARRFSEEPDFADFAGRLHLYGLDLRHVPSVERLGEHLARTLPRLDLVVQNAAQTVRRPVHFYSHLLDEEARPLDTLPEALRPLLGGHESLRRVLERDAALLLDGQAPSGGGPMPQSPRGGGALAMQPESPGALRSTALGLLSPALLATTPLLPEDAPDEAHAFPEGSYDGDAQQIDLRIDNSWRKLVDDVSTVELLEVHLVNAVAPFILLRTLLPLLVRSPTFDRHVVHVSAMEAQFSRKKKTERHPHTNMAKASLNMLTRTAAAELATRGVYLNSVDTGWVTDEDPLHHVSRKQEEHAFSPPLDSLDGAARVLDPYFTGLATGEHPFGRFFKDYRETDW